MKDLLELDVATANKQLDGFTVTERISWAVETFGRDAVLLSSMQNSASVLMHCFYRMELDNEVLFVDTGYHFRETLQLRDEFMRRYHLSIVTLYPELTPEQQEKNLKRNCISPAMGRKNAAVCVKPCPLLPI